MNTVSIRRSDILLTALAPIAWGTTYIVATELLPPGHPLLVASLRSLPVGILLIAWLKQLPKGIWWWRILLLGSLNIGIFQALLFVAAYRLPGGVAATAGAIQPLLVILFSWGILHEKPSKISIAAAVAGFVGVGLLVLGPAAHLDSVGVMAALAGAATMGLGTVLIKRWKRPVSLLTFTAWQLTVGGIVLLPVALITEGPFTQLSPKNLLGFVYLGLIGTGLAYALWFRGIDKLKASAVSYLGLLSPVVATLLGFALLRQTLTLIQLIGIGIVLFSVLIGQRANQLGKRSFQRLRVAREIQRFDPPGLDDPSQHGFTHVVQVPANSALIYISGQLGFDQQGNLADDFASQLQQAFANLRMALAAAGTAPEQVVKITLLSVGHTAEKQYLIEAARNAMWSGDRKPASTLIPVPRLAVEGGLFEIDAIAAIPNS